MSGRWLRHCVILPVMVCGCAATPRIDEAASARSVPEIDSTRAHLPLNQIDPDPPAPASPVDALPELSPSSVRRLSRAMERYAQQRFTEAALELEKALRHDPEHPTLQRALARALFAGGNVERARAHLRKAVAADSNDIVSHYLLGRLAYDDGRNEEAILQYRIALKCTNAPAHPAYVAAAQFHLARVLNAEGYLTAAIESYRAYESAVRTLAPDARTEIAVASLLQINGGNAGGPISVAYEKLGRFDEAADALAASIRGREADVDTRARWVRLLASADRFDEALRAARELLSDSDGAISLLAEIHERAGHPEAVVEDIRGLYEDQPDRPALLTAYVDVLSRFGRWDEAERVLRAAADHPPVDVAVYWRLSDVCRNQGKWSEAVEAAATGLRTDAVYHDTARDKVLELAGNPQAVTTVLGAPGTVTAAGIDYARAFLMGTIASAAGRAEDASSLYRRSIADHADFAPARIELAKILLDRYAWDDVVALVVADDEALRNDGRLQRLCGLAYVGLDDAEKAEQYLSTAIRLDRTDTEAMFALGQLVSEQREPHRARRQYEALLEVNPLHEAAREALFHVLLFGLDQREDAAVQLADLRRLAASPHRIARCQAWMDLGRQPSAEDWEKFRAQLERALEQSGPDAETLDRIVQSYLAEDYPERALVASNRAMQVDPDGTDFLVRRAQVYRRLLDYPKAIETMDRLLQRHPYRSAWIDLRLTWLIEDHRFTDAFAAAIEQGKRVGLADPEKRKYRAFALRALERDGQFDREIQLLDRWIAEEPEDDLWAELRIEALRGAKRFDDAIAAERRWYQDHPERSVRNSLVGTYRLAERYVEAEQFLLGELENDPDNVEFVEQLITTLMFAERHDDALDLIENLRYRIPASIPGIRVLETSVLQHAGRYDKVIRIWSKELREAEAESPRSQRIVVAKRGLITGLMLAARLEEAATKLKLWIEATESPWERFELLSRLSTCEQMRGQPLAALEAMRRQYAMRDELRAAMSHSPRDRALASDRITGLNNDLGYSLADSGQRLVEARRMIRYALYRRPQSGAYLDSYGWVLYKSGEYAEARRWFEKALASENGEDPVVFDHLGDTLWRLGRSEEAVAKWTKAVAMIDEALDTLDRTDQRTLRTAIKAKIEAHLAGDAPKIAPPGSIETETITGGGSDGDDSDS